MTGSELPSAHLNLFLPLDDVDGDLLIADLLLLLGLLQLVGELSLGPLSAAEQAHVPLLTAITGAQLAAKQPLATAARGTALSDYCVRKGGRVVGTWRGSRMYSQGRCHQICELEWGMTPKRQQFSTFISQISC